MGDRLIVGIPAKFKDGFKKGDDVEVVKIVVTTRRESRRYHPPKEKKNDPSEDPYRNVVDGLDE